MGDPSVVFFGGHSGDGWNGGAVAEFAWYLQGRQQNLCGLPDGEPCLVPGCGERKGGMVRGAFECPMGAGALGGWPAVICGGRRQRGRSVVGGSDRAHRA